MIPPDLRRGPVADGQDARPPRTSPTRRVADGQDAHPPRTHRHDGLLTGKMPVPRGVTDKTVADGQDARPPRSSPTGPVADGQDARPPRSVRFGCFVPGLRPGFQSGHRARVSQPMVRLLVARQSSIGESENWRCSDRNRRRCRGRSVSPEHRLGIGLVARRRRPSVCFANRSCGRFQRVHFRALGHQLPSGSWRVPGSRSSAG